VKRDQQDQRSKRTPAVDALRGLCIVLMFLVSARSPWTQLRHAPWLGLHLADCVYPAFLVVAGISMRFSRLAQDARHVPRKTQRLKMFRRCGLLFLIGIILLSASYRRLRLNLGTLQCIAVILLAASPFSGFSPGRKLCVAGMVLLVSWLLISVVGIPGIDPALCWQEHFCLSEYIDTAILGKPKGIEGILPTFTLISAVLFGMVAAAFREDRHFDVLKMTYYGSALLAAGWIAVFCGVPISPAAASPSFVLLTSGGAVLCLALIDTLLRKSSSSPLLSTPFRIFEIFGTNALAVYAFVKLAQVSVFHVAFLSDGTKHVNAREWLATTAEHFAGEAVGNIAFPLTKVLLGYVFCLLLYRKKIFLRL
jgi:predicted acyltransferase